jgi:hypothetical protein
MYPLFSHKFPDLAHTSPVIPLQYPISYPMMPYSLLASTFSLEQVEKPKQKHGPLPK